VRPNYGLSVVDVAGRGYERPLVLQRRRSQFKST
jgi:hypothetical protein